MAPALPNLTTFAPAGTLKSELALLPEAASDEAAPELAALEEALPPQALVYTRTEGHLDLWRYGTPDRAKAVTIF